MMAAVSMACVYPDTESDALLDKEYVTITYVVDDRMYMQNIIEKGTAPAAFYYPPVPEGYTEWDTDLTQPVYKSIYVHAIPEDKSILDTPVPALVIVAALAFVSLLITWRY